MAVAVRREVTEQKRVMSPVGTHSPVTQAGTRPRRRRARRPRGLLGFVVPMLVAASFCYVGLYASVTALCYSKNRAAALCREQKIQNERLRLELVRRSSPRDVTSAAQKAGMIYATQYDYLTRPASVMSAKAGD